MSILRKTQHTAPERIGVLLPWLNDPIDVYGAKPDEVTAWSQAGHAAIDHFLASFDGSDGAGHVQVVDVPADMPEWLREKTKAREMDPGALQELQTDLQLLLKAGFEGEPLGFSAPSLRFTVSKTPRADIKRSRATRKERRAWESPGAFVLQVGGTIRDLVVYLVAQLLTAPGMVTLGRCKAPEAYDQNARCGRFIVNTATGRPRVFCSDACRVRHSYRGVKGR